jgi:hypothetical protein
MSKIEEAIEDFIQRYLNGMDFSDLITNEVRDTWDMDELNRVDETVDRVDALEAWINDAEDKFSIQNVIDLENSIKNMDDHIVKLFQIANELLHRVDVLESRKSFIQKLMFWRS